MKKLKRNIHALVSFALMLALLSPALAQGTTDGTIAGTVYDQQGAVISGAKVTVKNAATNQTFTAQTSDNGAFRINNVPVGVYSIKIEVENFKAYSNPSVAVQLNRVTDVNVTLEPGAVSEVVTVTAGAAAELVETSTWGGRATAGTDPGPARPPRECAAAPSCARRAAARASASAARRRP